MQGIAIRTLIFVLLLFLGMDGWAQPDVPAPDPTIPDGKAGVDFNREDAKGKQGLWVKVYRNGSIYYKGEFINDVPQGTFWFWYDDGKPMRRVEHLEGTAHMYAVHYHPNGRLMSEGHYKQGIDPETNQPDKVRDGEWVFYNETGDLKSRETYVLGLKHGDSRSYYDSGKILREEHYVSGKKEGKFTEYFENGRVHAVRNHANDTFHGETILYESDGSLLIKGNYVNGLKDGIWMHFESGKIRITTKYKLGEEIATRRENGEFTDYYPSGIPKATYVYEDGKKNGPFTEWHDVGEWVREPMNDPAPGGGIQFIEKLIGTAVLCEGDYMDDKPEGTLTYYDEKGKITKIETYVGGQLTSTTTK